MRLVVFFAISWLLFFVAPFCEAVLWSSFRLSNHPKWLGRIIDGLVSGPTGIRGLNGTGNPNRVGDNTDTTELAIEPTESEDTYTTIVTENTTPTSRAESTDENSRSKTGSERNVTSGMQTTAEWPDTAGTGLKSNKVNSEKATTPLMYGFSDLYKHRSISDEDTKDATGLKVTLVPYPHTRQTSTDAIVTTINDSDTRI